MSSFTSPYSVNSVHSGCQAVDLPVLVRWCSILLTTIAATTIIIDIIECLLGSNSLHDDDDLIESLKKFCAMD